MPTVMARNGLRIPLETKNLISNQPIINALNSDQNRNLFIRDVRTGNPLIDPRNSVEGKFRGHVPDKARAVLKVDITRAQEEADKAFAKTQREIEEEVEREYEAASEEVPRLADL